MAQAFFLSLAGLAAVFFLWRMRADPLAVAFGASVVYFTPGFFGVAQFSYGQGLEIYSMPIVSGAYVAMGLVFIALTAAALIVDRIPTGPLITFGFEKKIAPVFVSSAIIFLAVSVHNTGVYYLCLDKLFVLSKLDVWYSYASF